MNEQLSIEPAKPRALAIAPPEDADGLIRFAIQHGGSVDTLERIMALRKELKAEAAKESFDRALAAFQGACPVIEKTKIVKDKTGGIRYKFAPLDSIVSQVKELLKEHGFSYSMDTEPAEKAVRSICKVTHRDGHSQVSRFEVPIEPGAFMSAPQQYASALTFSKRYAFVNAFGILTGDEDADAVKKEKPQAPSLIDELRDLLKKRGLASDWDGANKWLRSKAILGDKEALPRLTPIRMKKLLEDIEHVL